MQARTIILATRNPDKVRELQAILAHSNWELISLDTYPDIPEVVENGQSLRENALKKAAATHHATGFPSLADDTGLEVDVLNGAPGVHSSRYAGEKATYGDNCRKLLTVLQGVPREKRTARFRCVSAFVDKERTHCEDGVCEGLILDGMHGQEGFGYDPLFFVPETGKTFAEMSLMDKNTVSHRARAFRSMAEWLEKQLRFTGA